MARTKSSNGKSARKKTRRAARGGSGKPTFGAKTEFVRARPDKTAQEVVEEATQQGLSLTVGYVYNIRTLERKRGSRRPQRAPVPARSTVGGSEQSFRTLVLRIGLDRAEAVLSELKAAFAASAAPSPVGRRPRRASRDVLPSGAELSTNGPADTAA